MLAAAALQLRRGGREVAARFEVVGVVLGGVLCGLFYRRLRRWRWGAGSGRR